MSIMFLLGSAFVFSLVGYLIYGLALLKLQHSSGRVEYCKRKQMAVENGTRA
jgi:hypothetical protein